MEQALLAETAPNRQVTGFDLLLINFLLSMAGFQMNFEMLFAKANPLIYGFSRTLR